jgi:hypothetical protein
MRHQAWECAYVLMEVLSREVGIAPKLCNRYNGVLLAACMPKY